MYKYFMKSIESYFKTAVEAGASDVHLVGGELPMMRVEGVLQNMEEKALAQKELETAILSLLNTEQKKKFQEAWELDFGYEIKDIRFRVNIHKQENTLGLASRIISGDIPDPTTLGFEPALQSTANLMDGLVLVVGPTGHGKSTTLASIIEEINKTRKSHIITIEDPIEFLFEDKESLIEQREIGTDTKSFADALKHVLRQDPNIILVGEMRDPETIATVLTAAETGHVVFSTLHTSTAAEAIERIVDVFDGPKQKQILIQLSSVLRVVVAQQLVPTRDGRRVAAREILVNTPAVANLIRENNIAQLFSAIQTGSKDGMQTMEMSLKQLLKQNIIDEETFQNRTAKHKRI